MSIFRQVGFVDPNIETNPPIIFGGPWPMCLGDGFEFYLDGVTVRLKAFRVATFQEWCERYGNNPADTKRESFYYEFISD